MKRLLFTSMIVVAAFGGWEVTNRPLDEPQWTGQIDGLAYSPMRPGQNPVREQFPTEAEIAADIAIIAEHSRSLRTYSVDGTLGLIPEIAAKHDLSVTAGVWLDADLTANQARLARLKQLVEENSNIERVIVGNETILTGELTIEVLTDYLSLMREQLDVPVSTAEPWNIWLAQPELANHVDFVTVHLLPYWEGVPAQQSVGLVTERMRELSIEFTDLPIVIGEVGWPSNGRSRGAAAASRPDAETFLRRFLTAAESLDYEYFLMEAFDQPWKRADEGAVGAYWGLYNGARESKYAFSETLRAIPERRTLALLAAILSGLSFLLLTIDSKKMRWSGFGLLAATTFVAGNAIVWSLYDYPNQYWNFGDTIAAGVMLAGLVGILLLVYIEVHEWAEANLKLRSRAIALPENLRLERTPKISIHVPVYAEPPGMVIKTLDALAQLDYPNFEVLVIDNNTTTEALWRPVQAHCARLGEQFRFSHIASLAGFKAGALNYSLERTASDAEIVAVIDSDYCVEPDWLKRLVPYFDDANTALVQAPQDYRDHGTQAFKKFCEAEYRGFFKIGMVTRNERNAIIQHGTMTMIRATVLREIGGWAEWTVTEDAELGLRIFEHGYDAVYTTESFGRGLTPDRFRDYRAQRYRWAIGATQILKRHGTKLLGLAPSKLTMGQRFHFLTGWAAWLGDGLNLAFNLIAIFWSALMILAPEQFLAPVAKFSGFVLAFFMFKLVKMGWLYKRQVRASMKETAAAILAGLSLVFITGRAVLAGFGGIDAVFVRTPKLANKDGVLGALMCVASEILLASALISLAIAVTITAPFESMDRKLWSTLLIVFAIPHVAAVALSLLSTVVLKKKRRVAALSNEAITESPKA